MMVDIDDVGFYRETVYFEMDRETEDEEPGNSDDRNRHNGVCGGDGRGDGGEVLMVAGDIHLGLERELQDSGYNMSFDEEGRLERKLRDCLSYVDPDVVVFNGDIHHRFDEISSAAETIKRIDEVVESRGSRAVYVEGNHDTMLDSVVDTTGRYIWGSSNISVCCMHGDEVPVDLPDADLYVVGHDHPYIEIEMDKQPCYLYGDFRDGNVLVVPPFNPFCSGTVVNSMSSSDFMTPFVRGDFGEFRVVVEKEKGEVLKFPEIREFRNML